MIAHISYFEYPNWAIVLMFKLMFTFNTSMQIYTAHVASEASLEEMRGNFMDR